MTELEDRITTILRMRLSGKDENEIAQSLGIPLPELLDAEKKAARLITESVERGARGVQQISQDTSLPNSVVSIYASHESVNIYRDTIKISSNQRLEAVKYSIQFGAASIGVIAEMVGLSPNAIYLYARRARGGLQRRYNQGQRLEAITKALAEGVNSLEELCKRTHLKPSGFKKFCDENSLTLPSDLIPFKYKPELDGLIEQGRSLTDMGSRAQVTREGIRQYINHSGQYNLWRAARQEVKNAHKGELLKREEMYGQLLAVLEARVAQLAQNESWAVQMAIKHKMITKSTSTTVPYKNIVKIFERYERAQRKGKKVSLKELGKRLELQSAYVGRILQRVGIEPMYGARPHRHHYSEEEKRAIKKLVQIGMPNQDIAYFVGLPYHFTQYNFVRKRIGKNPAEPFIPETNFQLTYRLASRIYEAQAAGFRRSEIAELLDTSNEIVKYSIDNKHKIAPKIVKALKIVYSNQHYDNPYKMTEKK